jgi:hypothetical protein
MLTTVHAARGLGDPDQLDMAGVQVAHRRHEDVVGLLLQPSAQLRGGMDYVHGDSGSEYAVRQSDIFPANLCTMLDDARAMARFP